MKLYITSLVMIVLLLSTILGFLLFFFPQQTAINVTGYSLYDTLPNNSKQLQVYPNMRFASRNISYSINETCTTQNIIRIQEAFRLLANKTQVIDFYETNKNAKITVNCNDTLQKREKSHIQLGEGGIYEIINLGDFHIINKGKVTLYKNEKSCEIPNVEIHEILHALGFVHLENPNYIMFNYSFCNQFISADVINEIRRLYNIPEFGDLSMQEVTVAKNRRTLDINTSIMNRGIRNAKNVTLTVKTPEREIVSFDIGTIAYGNGKKIKITNLNYYNAREVTIEVSSGPELDYANNKKTIVL